jgi:hypothetical protein
MNLQRDTQRERLFYIDFLAFFTGQVTRKDLVMRFGISEPAATKDLALYAEMAPGMLQYSLRQRCYVLTGEAPFFHHDVDQTLYALSGDRATTLDTEHAKRVPSWVQSSIKRKMPVSLVAAITRAMHLRRKVAADYVSLNSGSAERILSPLALVHDGLRWHIRCYDHGHNEFRDYNLARFNAVSENGLSEFSLEQDVRWITEVTVKLVPHPKSMHPQTIRLDYDIVGDTKEVLLRPCLVPYFLRHWHIDSSLQATGNPLEQQLYLLNRQELLDLAVPSWAFDA